MSTDNICFFTLSTVSIPLVTSNVPPYTVPASAAWKVYYGVRNESLLRRKRKGWLLFVLAQLNCFRTHAHRTRKRHLPKEEERVLLKANFRGLIDGFTFNPRVDFLK